MVDVKSQNISFIGMNNIFGEGSALAALAGAFVEPKPISHVSMVGGDVRCVGIVRRDESYDTLGAEYYCWDTRLPLGQQIVEVTGVAFSTPILYTFADRYLVAIGWDPSDSGAHDIEVYWADLQSPSATPAFTVLHESRTTGSGFLESQISSNERDFRASLQILSDDVLCWLALTSGSASEANSDRFLHCYAISSNVTHVMGEAALSPNV